LREHVTAGSSQAQALLSGLHERLSGAALPDAESAALKQLYGMVMREAEVQTLNTMFHILALVLFLTLLLMPWVSKVTTGDGQGGAH
jgi:MFS transporter, DHA2 family, multidrug resistance protein